MLVSHEGYKLYINGEGDLEYVLRHIPLEISFYQKVVSNPAAKVFVTIKLHGVLNKDTTTEDGKVRPKARKKIYTTKPRVFRYRGRLIDCTGKEIVNHIEEYVRKIKGQGFVIVDPQPRCY